MSQVKLRRWEVPTKMNAGLCVVSDVGCGYCARCSKLFEIGMSKKWGNGIQNWKSKEEFLIGNWSRYERNMIKDDLDKRELRNKIRLEEGGDIPHMLLTVSFENIQVNDIENQGKRYKEVEEMMIFCMSRYDLTDGIGAVEFHSDKSPKGGNLHFHICAPINSNVYKRDRKTTIIGKVAKACRVERNWVDLKINGGATFKQRVGYICGCKKEGKVEYSALDKAWRDRFELCRVVSQLGDNMERVFKDELEWVRA